MHRDKCNGEPVHCDCSVKELKDINLEQLARIVGVSSKEQQPIPIRLQCPNTQCNAMHIDSGKFLTKPHHTHACQYCGATWRPAIVNTIGVRFLPGFKDGTV